MTESAGPAPSLLERALTEAPTRVVVVGGGIGGLVAARDIARPGFEVTVLEASERLGGTIAAHTVAGVRLDAGAESFATRGGHVAALLTELGIEDAIVAPNPAGSWLQTPRGAVPAPKNGLLGIPSVPLATDVIAAIGWGGALRAHLDRLIPVLKVGKERDFGRLVRRRMGRAVHDLLVAPITSGVYSADPDVLDTEAVAPGLSTALTRAGSLSGAVALMRAGAAGGAKGARRDSAGADLSPGATGGGPAQSPAGEMTATGVGSKPGSAVGGIVGGMARVIEVLAADVAARGGVVRTGACVTAVLRAGDAAIGTVPDVGAESRPDAGTATVPDAGAAEGADTVPEAGAAAPGDAEGDAAGAPAPWRVELANGEVLDADSVVIATPARQALALLAGISDELAQLAGLDWPQPTEVELVTLVVDAPALDAAPRGTGMLVAEAAQNVRAKALTHVTAKWEWVAAAVRESRHVIRLSYGRAGRPDDDTAGLDDAKLRDIALSDAGVLLGMPLEASMLVDWDRVRWNNAPQLALRGQQDRIDAVRAGIEALDGLDATGSWLCGTGTASVVPDARAAAARIRGLRWRVLTEKD